jgi:glycosyltransferase involved in cell wall biosynthesis/GT2 family glycosyltransferase
MSARSVSVVIPVLNAGPLLTDVLAAVRAQGKLELLVIDSGSSDGSPDVARAAGARVLEIPPAEFGHGRTRNLGASETSGELICFITQDALPLEGWLAAYRETFELEERIGAAFGPHLPHPDTSPMIARELTEFFAGFAPNGSPSLQRSGDLSFLSNVNACYARACWEELGFPDVEYAEDQAFGLAMLEAGWVKAFQPRAAVRHAHDYGPVEFMRRYFDEYRGLREVSGHVEPLHLGAAAREVRADARWMREQGLPAPQRAGWLARSAVHHTGRRAASALGSRAQRLPNPVQRALSLEGRGGNGARTSGGAPGATTAATGSDEGLAAERGSAAGASASGEPAVQLPHGREIAARPGPGPYEEILRFHRDGSAPLDTPIPGMAERGTLHLAVLIPPFARGSGGHNTIFTLVGRLEEMGHTCSIWMYDPHHRHHEPASVLRRRIVDEFLPLRAPVHKSFDSWSGADVAIATGWDTAYQAAILPGCRARAYMINDHEPEFFATSAESLWAEGTYRLGLHGIAASRWLRDLLEQRYGQRGGWFRLGADRGIYRPRPVERQHDTVIFYARGFTPRRAVALGALACEELHRRRPDTHFVLFGQAEEMELPFPYELLGVVSPETLAWRYSEATVGLCLSLTNYSLIPQEMMACGLPCVDITGGSTEGEIGPDGGVELAAPDPVALADALERLLDDEQRWQQRSEAGLAFVETASWDVAASQVEAALREALRERETLRYP